MRIDERIVIQMPKSILETGVRRRKTWARHAAIRALWNLRRSILEKTGEDIIGMFTMQDCIELNIHADIQTINEKDK